MGGENWGPAVEIAPEYYGFTSAALAKSLEFTEHVHRREKSRRSRKPEEQKKG
jgi:hypothetical protein